MNQPAQTRATRFEFIKRWSPAFLPPLTGIALLLVALFFASESGIVGVPPVSPSTLIALLAIYLVLGMIWGVVLYAATQTLIWLLVALGGVVSYLVVTASVYWGVIGGIVCVALLAAFLAWYGRRHSYDVPGGSAAVTTFAGDYLRTLRAGVWVLAPGERIVDTVELRDQTLVCGPVSIRVAGERGQPMLARAAAAVGYRPSVVCAHLIVLTPREWQQELNALASSSLEHALDEWARLPQNFIADTPAKQLGVIYHRDLLESTRSLGLRGLTVNIQDASLEADQEPAPQQQALAPSRAPVATPHVEPPQLDASTTPLVMPATALYSARNLPNFPAATDVDSPPPLPDALNPEVLKEAYQAVAERRITDSATIRAIADAFATLARDPERAAELDFDPEAAARILLQHVVKHASQQKSS